MKYTLICKTCEKEWTLHRSEKDVHMEADKNEEGKVEVKQCEDCYLKHGEGG